MRKCVNNGSTLFSFRLFLQSNTIILNRLFAWMYANTGRTDWCHKSQHNVCTLMAKMGTADSNSSCGDGRTLLEDYRFRSLNESLTEAIFSEYMKKTAQNMRLWSCAHVLDCIFSVSAFLVLRWKLSTDYLVERRCCTRKTKYPVYGILCAWCVCA